MPEYEESADARIDRERTEEGRAFFKVLASVFGLSRLPKVNSDSLDAPMIDVKAELATVAQGKHIPAPLRLELLARLSQPSRPGAIDDDDVSNLARSLVRVPDDGEKGGGSTSGGRTSAGSDGEMAGDIASDLLGVLRRWEPGQEPLGRTTLADLESPPANHVTASLHPDIQCTMLTFDVGCGAKEVTVAGNQALSIVTDMHTCKPLDLFERVINPFKWPGCWLESFFFKSMVAVPTPPKADTPLPDSDKGWRQCLLETVDFGFAIAPDGTQELQTELDFLYFWNAPPNPTFGPTPHGTPGTPPRVSYNPGTQTGVAVTVPVVTRSEAPAAGCTYDLRSSYDNRILVDQGFLLVEEVPGHPYRRYRTQKEVRFAVENPTGDICSFWSLATGMIMQGC